MAVAVGVVAVPRQVLSGDRGDVIATADGTGGVNDAVVAGDVIVIDQWVEHERTLVMVDLDSGDEVGRHTVGEGRLFFGRGPVAAVEYDDGHGTLVAIGSDGRELWTASPGALPPGLGLGLYMDDDPPVGAYRIGGDVFIVASGEQTVVLDGATGDVVAQRDEPVEGVDANGGLAFDIVGGDLVARSLPDLAEMWRIDWPEHSWPVAHGTGVIAVAYDDDAREYTLTGFGDR